jgi:hypothetical protein
VRNASIIGVVGSDTCSSRSFGTTISVSTAFLSSVMPRSACVARSRPSNPNGRVTTPIVSASSAASDLRDDRRAAGAGAAALARGDEHHVRALEDLLDLVAVLLDRPATDLGVRARPEAARGLTPDVELDLGIGHQQRLRVRVDRDELDPPQTAFDHAVDRVHTSPADPDHLDDGEVVLRRIHHRDLRSPVKPPGSTWGNAVPVSLWTKGQLDIHCYI